MEDAIEWLLPFSASVDWTSFSLRVPVADVLARPLMLPRLLRAIPTSRVAQLQAELRRARHTLLYGPGSPLGDEFASFAQTSRFTEAAMVSVLCPLVQLPAHWGILDYPRLADLAPLGRAPAAPLGYCTVERRSAVVCGAIADEHSCNFHTNNSCTWLWVHVSAE